jgi:Domain of unknown function (DUF4160)
MARIEIAVEDESLEKLSAAFFGQKNLQPANDREPSMEAILASMRRIIAEPTDSSHDGTPSGPWEERIATVYGLAIKIWADEHPPPHFHVAYQGEDASFSILDCTRL